MDAAAAVALKGFGLPLLLGAAVLLAARRPWKRAARAPAWAVGLAPVAAFVLAWWLVKGTPPLWPARDPSLRLPHVAVAAWVFSLLLEVVAPVRLKMWARRAGGWVLRLAAAAAIAWALSPHRRARWPLPESAAFMALASLGGAAHWRMSDALARSAPAVASGAVCALAAGAAGLVLLGAGIASSGQLAGLVGMAYALIALTAVRGGVPVAPFASGVAGLMIPAFLIYAAILTPGDAPWLPIAAAAAALPAAGAIGSVPAPRLRLAAQLLVAAGLCAAAAWLSMPRGEASLY